MKTSTWVILLILIAVLAFAGGYYASTIKKVYTNREKIEGGLEILSGLEKVF